MDKNTTFNELIKHASIERGLATQQFAKEVLKNKANNKIIGNCTSELVEGVREVTEVVNSTLGPNGRLVLFNEGGEIKATKDGVTVAKSIKLENAVRDYAARLLLQAARETAVKVGDGTTTTCIYTSAILDNLISQDIKDFYEVKKGMDQALTDVTNMVDKHKKEVDLDLLRKVLFTSSNNSKEISESIANIYSKLSKWDIEFLFHETGEQVDSVELEVGYELTHKSPSINYKTIKNDVGVIILNYKPTAIGTNLARIMESWSFDNKLPLLFICRDFSEEFINDLQNHSTRYSMPLFAVKADLYGKEADMQLADLAYATSAEIIENIPMGPISPDVIGTLKTVIFNLNKTNLIFEETIDEYIDSLEDGLKDCKDPIQEENLKVRINKLKGVTANYYVGGKTPQEMQERYYRIEDAIQAASSAIKQGVVLGGGSTNIKIYNKLKEHISDNPDFSLGYNAVINSLIYPFFYLCRNSFMEQEDYLEILDYLKENKYVFNFQTKEYETIEDTNIYDPAAASVVALEGAISVTSTILLTKTVIL